MPHENIYLQDYVAQSPNYVKQLVNTNDITTLSKILLVPRTDVNVYNYNGTGQDFQVYYQSQQADAAIPILGMTNQQARSRWGLSLGGGVITTSTQTLPGVVGWIAPISTPTPNAWYLAAAVSTTSADTLPYKVKGISNEPGEVDSYTVSVNLVPGLNVVPISYTFAGQQYKTAFVIWGNFANAGPMTGDTNLDGRIARPRLRDLGRPLRPDDDQKEPRRRFQRGRHRGWSRFRDLGKQLFANRRHHEPRKSRR